MSAKKVPMGDARWPIVLGAQEEVRRWPELWAAMAYVTAASYALLLLYLFARPGGRGPVFAYNVGRPIVELLALVTAGFGLVWCALHRPIYQKRRIAPLACLSLVIAAAAIPLAYPSSHASAPSSVCFRLPIDGEWTVFWGGDNARESRLAAYSADRRWGLDLVVTVEGRSHTGAGLSPTDFYVHGRDVYAPADGTVVRVNDGVAESRPGIYDSRTHEFGNYIVIEVAPGQFAFLAHLLAGSIQVAAGQRVRVGDPLARVGNSGYSMVTPEPHLAIHLQDSAEPGGGEAIPWTFCEYTADGVRVQRGLPRGGIGSDGTFLGERVEPAALTNR